MNPVKCNVCSKEFTPKYKNRGKVCSEPCRAAAISKSKVKYSPEQESQILDLRDQKKTREEISKITGIKLSKIKSVLGAHGKVLDMTDRQSNAKAGLIREFGSIEKWSEHCRAGLTGEIVKKMISRVVAANKARAINDGLTNQKRYYLRHQDQIRAMWNQWNRDNAEYRASQTAKRRAIKLRAVPKWSDEEMKVKIEAIYEERESHQHVDHIYPLQGRDVSGLHVPENLRLISAEENLLKGNKMPAPKDLK